MLRVVRRAVSDYVGPAVVQGTGTKTYNSYLISRMNIYVPIEHIESILSLETYESALFVLIELALEIEIYSENHCS